MPEKLNFMLQRFLTVWTLNMYCTVVTLLSTVACSLKKLWNQWVMTRSVLIFSYCWNVPCKEDPLISNLTSDDFFLQHFYAYCACMRCQGYIGQRPYRAGFSVYANQRETRILCKSCSLFERHCLMEWVFMNPGQAHQPLRWKNRERKEGGRVLHAVYSVTCAEFPTRNIILPYNSNYAAHMLIKWYWNNSVMSSKRY